MTPVVLGQLAPGAGFVLDALHASPVRGRVVGPGAGGGVLVEIEEPDRRLRRRRWVRVEWSRAIVVPSEDGTAEGPR